MGIRTIRYDTVRRGAGGALAVIRGARGKEPVRPAAVHDQSLLWTYLLHGVARSTAKNNSKRGESRGGPNKRGVRRCGAEESKSQPWAGDAQMRTTTVVGAVPLPLSSSVPVDAGTLGLWAFGRLEARRHTTYATTVGCDLLCQSFLAYLLTSAHIQIRCHTDITSPSVVSIAPHKHYPRTHSTPEFAMRYHPCPAFRTPHWIDLW